MFKITDAKKCLNEYGPEIIHLWDIREYNYYYYEPPLCCCQSSTLCLQNIILLRSWKQNRNWRSVAIPGINTLVYSSLSLNSRQWIQQMILNLQVLSNILFTDEAGFMHDDIFNYNNIHVWCIVHPHIIHEAQK